MKALATGQAETCNGAVSLIRVVAGLGLTTHSYREPSGAGLARAASRFCVRRISPDPSGRPDATFNWGRLDHGVMV